MHHLGQPEVAQALADELVAALGDRLVEAVVSESSAVLAAHAGPGCSASWSPTPDACADVTPTPTHEPPASRPAPACSPRACRSERTVRSRWARPYGRKVRRDRDLTRTVLRRLDTLTSPPGGEGRTGWVRDRAEPVPVPHGQQVDRPRERRSRPWQSPSGRSRCPHPGDAARDAAGTVAPHVFPMSRPSADVPVGQPSEPPPVRDRPPRPVAADPRPCLPRGPRPRCASLRTLHGLPRHRSDGASPSTRALGGVLAPRRHRGRRGAAARRRCRPACGVGSARRSGGAPGPGTGRRRRGDGRYPVCAGDGRHHARGRRRGRCGRRTGRRAAAGRFACRRCGRRRRRSHRPGGDRHAQPGPGARRRGADRGAGAGAGQRGRRAARGSVRRSRRPEHGGRRRSRRTARHRTGPRAADRGASRRRAVHVRSTTSAT